MDVASSKYGAALCLALVVFLLAWWWVSLTIAAVAGVIALGLMLGGERYATGRNW